MVSKRRYHFIIPSDEQWDEPLHQNAIDHQTHLLHGLIHCNGFGHLLLINGRQGGSKHITGREIMNLWDRICTSLQTRQVTVEDSSHKRSMDLKLLYGVAYGLTWFGRWGYRFHLGSYGVNQDAFDKAIDLIASQDLDGLIDDFEMIGREREFKRIVFTYNARYSRATVRDLLRNLLDSKNRSQPELVSSKPALRKQTLTPPTYLLKAKKRCRDFDDMAAELESRWPVRRLRGAADVIVDALLENGGVLTRQEVRDASRRTIGDTGLLDFVLKSLSDCIVGSYVVRRRQNIDTRVLEFTIENFETDDEPQMSIHSNLSGSSSGNQGCQTQNKSFHAERDINWVYKHVLLRGKAGETVMDGKLWSKKWALRDEEDDQLRFFCRWLPAEGDVSMAHRLTPAVLVVMPPHASVMELRQEAENALRDTYAVMENFVSTRLEGVAGEDWDPLFGAVESGATVWVRGVGVERKLVRYERGGSANSWTVECGCGTVDDDGERMVACDVCEVWQHTRCAGIDDEDEVPRMFLCGRCAGTVMAHHHHRHRHQVHHHHHHTSPMPVKACMDVL